LNILPVAASYAQQDTNLILGIKKRKKKHIKYPRKVNVNRLLEEDMPIM